MDSLPSEIVEFILASPKLKFTDVLNFGGTCKHFHKFVQQSSYIWKKKYQQKYPQFMKFLDNTFSKWYEEILYIHDIGCRTHTLLASMSPKLYKKSVLSDCDFAEWVVMMKEKPQTYQYIVFNLRSIINDCSVIHSIDVVPITTPGNRTFQFYALRVLQYLRQQLYTLLWEEYDGLLLKDQLLEKGATLVAQWCQTRTVFEWEDIAEQLDQLAYEVIKEVEIQFPKHPLLKTSKDDLLEWKLHNLDDNQWNIIECRQIMSCIMTVVFVRNNFIGCYDAYYTPENSYIDQVLSSKQGLPITLSVVFESIARRLGLNCQPYPFPSHFLLRFTEGKIEEKGETYYIDVFNQGNIIRKGRCPSNTNGSSVNPHGNIEIATPREVVERMANNLEVSTSQLDSINVDTMRSVLELICAVNSQDIQVVINLVYFYMIHDVDITPLRNFLLSDKFKNKQCDKYMHVVKMLRDYDLHRRHNFSEPIRELQPKVRSKGLLYAVGMIVNHVDFNHSCIIYDWDKFCTTAIPGQKQLPNHLKHGLNQPFYRLLVGDGSHCYAPQETLTVSSILPSLIPADLGKHFSHFFETHFVPNAEKEKHYPEDAEIRHWFHQQILFNR